VDQQAKERRVLNVGYLLLTLAMVAGALVAVLTQNLIRAAVALGVGSAALAMLLFLLGAPHAGGFELSVGAGLISVLFIVAISLVESVGRQRGEP
jgi:NADH-quinone oxidoreductase subunit J